GRRLSGSPCLRPVDYSGAGEMHAGYHAPDGPAELTGATELAPIGGRAFVEHLTGLAGGRRQQRAVVPVEHHGVTAHHVELVDLAGAIVRRDFFGIGGEPADALAPDRLALGFGGRFIDGVVADLRVDDLDHYAVVFGSALHRNVVVRDILQHGGRVALQRIAEATSAGGRTAEDVAS